MRKISILLFVLVCILVTVTVVTADGIVPALRINIGNTSDRSKESSDSETTEITVIKGKSTKLTAVFENTDNPKAAKISWESSDSNIAQVKGGIVVGKEAGSCMITCSAVLNDGTELRASICVKVEIGVKSILPANKIPYVFVGKTSESLEVRILPEDATCKSVVWSSSNEEIATVDSNGAVTGKAVGKVDIIATSEEKVNSGKPKVCKFSVTVNQAAEALVIGDEDTFFKGKSIKLDWTLLPENTTDKKVDWSSSDDTVAKVDSRGRITAVGCGSCTITGVANDGSGVTASKSINVIQLVNKVIPNTKKWVVLNPNGTASVSVEVLPKDATNQAIQWISSDPNIAAVDEQGTISGIAPGDCIVNAKTTDGGDVEAVFRVAVVPKKPITITDMNICLDFERTNPDCFNISAKNNTPDRIIKDFSLILIIRDSKSEEQRKSSEFSWANLASPIGPGQEVDPGERYWGCSGVFDPNTILEVYITKVLYSDGVMQIIPEEDRTVPDKKWKTGVI